MLLELAWMRPRPESERGWLLVYGDDEDTAGMLCMHPGRGPGAHRCRLCRYSRTCCCSPEETIISCRIEDVVFSNETKIKIRDLYLEAHHSPEERMIAILEIIGDQK